MQMYHYVVELTEFKDKVSIKKYIASISFANANKNILIFIKCCAANLRYYFETMTL